MSLFTFTHQRFLEELRNKTRSNAIEISEVVADAENLLDAERGATLDARIRMRRSGWALGESPVTIVPSEIPGYVLGVFHYPFRYFLPAIAIGYTPHAFAAVFLGDSFLKGRSVVFILIGAGILIGGMVYRLYRPRP